MCCVVTVCRLLALHLRFKICYLFLKFSSLQCLKFYLVSKSKRVIPLYFRSRKKPCFSKSLKHCQVDD